MSTSKSRREQLLSLCAEIGPLDGIDPRLLARQRGGKRKPRKTLQLCAQVAAALNLALPDSREPALQEVYVSRVEPAPDASRLLVRVAPNLPGAPYPEGLTQALARERVSLRMEAARAIVRKRVPQLLFAPEGKEAGDA